jgi:peptidyl-prolyl cis-trans isomerase B (cyclophilin B)
MLKGNNRIIVTAVIGIILLVGANFIFNSDDGFISSSNSMEGPKAVIETDFGNIVIQLYADAAPGHVDNFVQLAGQGYYDGTTFHRIIPGFMIQGGDPNSRDEDRRTHGMGGHSAKGPNTVVNAEFSKTLKHNRGILSMARSQDINSAGSQFFIVVADSHFLDTQYSIFGEVVEGMDVVDKIVGMPRDGNDNPHDRVVMNKVSIISE